MPEKPHHTPVPGLRAVNESISDGSRPSYPIANASLAFTVAEGSQLPPATGLELAFAGRSNAGKSSAINALTNRRGLAFVARRPGKTRTIQFFRVVDDRYLVDLPGYGYARVSATVRAQWGRLLESYLRKRSSLVGLMLIMDIRHPLTPLDQRLLDWIGPRDLPVHILLNKADKLTRAHANATLAEVERRLQSIACDCSVQNFSSVRPEGVGQAVEVIRRWLRLDPPDQREKRQNKNPRLKGSKAGGEMP